MNDDATLNLFWKPPGPVAARFMASTKPVQILNGPIGSGKTTACCIKIVRLATRQKPSSLDGVRKFKVCVVRDTYRQLWKTTLASWFKRFPRSEGTFNGAENAPASHTLNLRLADGTLVHLHVDFLAIGENAVEDVLRGYEPTMFYLNESDLLAREVYLYAKGRAGRYPDMSEGGPTWYGILMDCNAPELQSWLYEDIFRSTPADVDLFIQPSGFSDEAENTENLPPGYYTNQSEGQPEWYIERMIKNRPGYSRAGKPVFREFEDRVHVAPRPFDPVPGLPVLIGLDAGGSPGAVLVQRLPNGQWRVFDEIATEAGTGPTRFGEILARKLRERCPNRFDVRGWADPSSAYGADRKAGEKAWIEIVEAASGIRIDAAPTNALIPRLEAIRRPLTKLIDGKPGLLLSPGCIILREGFNSAYRYKLLRGAQLEQYDEEPEKNHPHSDVMDALGYALSGGGEDREIRERLGQRSMGARQQQSGYQHDWEPVAR